MATTLSEPAAIAATVKPARIVRHGDTHVTFRQRFTPASGNLQFLSCGEFDIPSGAESQSFSMANEESLLFTWKVAPGGAVHVTVGGETYELEAYDTLYIPKGASFSFSNTSVEAAKIIQCSAPAANVHPVHHTKFSVASGEAVRVARLTDKDGNEDRTVYKMFDVSEPADKLVAGYTFFKPWSRSWPPHNHTDQEEVYIFIKGKGAMTVYESDRTMSFVHSVNTGDMVTIPFLNYHPVFSQEDPLEFIWCIAGERYWVGDKNKNFLKGTDDKITT